MAEASVAECRDGPANLFLGVVLHKAHVCEDCVATFLAAKAPKFLGACHAGGKLCPEVGNVLGRVARWHACRGKHGTDGCLVELSMGHDAVTHEEDAFFLHACRVRWHGARCDAADICMMSPRRDEKFGAAAGFLENRHDHGDVRQVRPTGVRCIHGKGVTVLDGAAMALEDRAHAFAHRAEVYRHMGGIGDEIAFAVEYRAGKVETFLDVDRRGCLLEGGAHLFGDRHEQRIVDLEPHGVRLRGVIVRGPAGCQC